MPQVLTANRLRDGEVVYLASGDHWADQLVDAELLQTPAQGEHALARGLVGEQNQEVVNAYLFEVVVNGASLKPVKMREVIRAAGPTVRGDLGKQARG